MARKRKAMWRWVRRVLLWLVALGLVLVIAGLSLYLALDQPRPRPIADSRAAAEALAAKALAAYGQDAWKRTGAVRWTFRGSHHHLWDRERGLAQVRWGDTEVLVGLGDKRGRAYIGGREIEDPEERRELLERAYAYWTNDAYWLNPLRTWRDDGVSLAMAADDDGQRGLLVSYGGGGVTPGDAYLWFVDPKSGLPRAFRMWVSILPIGGLRASWQGWQRMSTGVQLATRHELGPLSLELTDIAAAPTLEKLLGGRRDPFARMFGR